MQVAHSQDRANCSAAIHCWVSGRVWALGSVAGRYWRSWQYHLVWRQCAKQTGKGNMLVLLAAVGVRSGLLLHGQNQRGKDAAAPTAKGGAEP